MEKVKYIVMSMRTRKEQSKKMEEEQSKLSSSMAMQLRKEDVLNLHCKIK